MKWLCGCIIINCALASFGCGSGAGAKALVGSYGVMISSMGKSDPDIMTVSPGADGKLLLTFAAGIVTDVSGPNPDGLRVDLHDSSNVTLAAQPAHVDHSTGSLTGTVTGMGTIKPDGTCDVMLHFVPASANPQDYQITGTKQ
jgi:hypothetical protein